MLPLFINAALLSSDDYSNAVMSYKGTCPDLIALIRLGWPYSWEVDIKKLSRDPSFWYGVPDHTWVETWWREALHRGVALDIQVPAHYHQRLVEQFATNPYGGFFYASRRKPFIEVLSKLAVWKMARYQQMLKVIGICSISDETAYKTMQEELASVCKDDFDIDYTGLDEPFQIMIRDIIQLSHALLVASCGDDEGKKSRALEVYVYRIREYLQHTGLASWVACRCAVNVLEGMIVAEFDHSRLGRLQSIIDRNDMLSLAEDIRPFYAGSTVRDFRSSRDEPGTLDFLMDTFAHPRFIRPYFESIPRNVRLEAGGKPVALVEILADSIHHRHDLPFEWMRTMPFSTEVIRTLIEKCGDCLPNLLSVLGEYSFVSITQGAPLKVQDTQRVLKIARDTDDPKILAGIATALVNANFLRIADAGLILKLLRVDSKTLLASTLFRAYKVLTERRDADSFNKEIMLIVEVARGVLDKPNEYPFQAICQAANFLAEHNRIVLPPLLNEEKRLGIELKRFEEFRVE